MSEILKNFKVVKVEDDPFTIPGTKITIWKIKATVDGGDREIYSTMSKALASEGFVGDVELYTNDRGKEYVRQAPKEEGGAGVASAGTWHDNSAGMAWGNSLTNAVATVALMPLKEKAQLEDVTKAIIETAHFYFDNRPDAPKEEKAGEKADEEDEFSIADIPPELL